MLPAQNLNPPADAPASLHQDAVQPIECIELLQAGLDKLDQGMTVFDQNLRLTAWNQTFLDLLEMPKNRVYLGASYESLIRFNAERGEYGPDLTPEEIDQLVAQRVRAARRQEAGAHERRRPNGRVLLRRDEPLPHQGFFSIYSDITDQRYFEHLTEHQNNLLEEQVRRRTAQLENANTNLRRAIADNERIAAALRRSEERLRLVNDTIPILIGYVDQQEIYQYANKGYSDWFGHPEGSVTGMHVPDVLGQDVYDQVRPYLRMALSGQQQTYEYQKTRNGKTRHARTTLVPETTPEGKTLGFFAFSYDITDQKRMQAALIQAQKMEAIGQLTGGLAHDFNNLLTVIIGNLAALQEQHQQNHQIVDYTEPALQSARRGAQLIRRLLAFSRQQPLEPEAVNVERLLSGLSKLVRRTLPENISLSTDLPGGGLHACADAGQLESALLNFALNARDAMPDGGQLHIAARATHLDPTAAERFDVCPGDYALFEVTDNGCGMDHATLTRIFEPFFTTKRFGLGSGLGLSMAYGFIKQSGGGILVRSAPGRGTSMMMVLPRITPRNEEEVPEEDNLFTTGGELVLLVEDDANVRRVIRQQLVDLGHPVIEAEHGHQALEMCRQIPDIAIVCSDVIMPNGLNGHQLAEHLLAEFPGKRMILMSGYHDEAARSPQLHLLVKPFTRRDLARALEDSRQPLSPAASVPLTSSVSVP